MSEEAPEAQAHGSEGDDCQDHCSISWPLMAATPGRGGPLICEGLPREIVAQKSKKCQAAEVLVQLVKK
jgi:hypothetical protein